MSINFGTRSITLIPSVAGMLAQMRSLAATAADKPATVRPGSGGFGAAIGRGLQQVNAAEASATKVADAFQSGQSDVPLYRVMLATQKASLSLQFGLQVRNGLVGAYNDVMNMQI